MTPVGGSRHYDGGGLGQVGMWACPSCGEDNTGPLTQGCTSCGAGKPGHRGSVTPETVGAPPEAPPPPEDDHTIFTNWLQRHPDATLEQAYTAGYIEGVRAQLKTLRANSPAAFPPEHKERRTAIAALELFRDQVLTKDHEGVESGEWCSPAEVTAIIKQLQQEIDHV